MAKVKLALKALDQVLDDLPDHLAKLREKSGLVPLELELEFTGSINIDRDGGVDVGAEAEAEAPDVLQIASGGVPLRVKGSAGFGSKWDNTGSVNWKLRARFG